MVCQFYFFKKNQLLALLIFAMVSLVSFAFISALIFKIEDTQMANKHIKVAQHHSLSEKCKSKPQ